MVDSGSSVDATTPGFRKENTLTVNAIRAVTLAGYNHAKRAKALTTDGISRVFWVLEGCLALGFFIQHIPAFRGGQHFSRLNRR